MWRGGNKGCLEIGREEKRGMWREKEGRTGCVERKREKKGV